MRRFIITLAVLLLAALCGCGMSQPAKSPALSYEVIKVQQTQDYAEFKIKVTNIDTVPVGQTETTMILIGPDGRELDSDDHYTLSMDDPDLMPGESRFSRFFFQVDASTVARYRFISHGRSR